MSDYAELAPLVSLPVIGRAGAVGVPAPVTGVIGREEETAAAVGLLRGGVRLLTFVGPGGVGKSRLAVEVAGRLVGEFGDGVAFVPLAPVLDEALVAATVAQALAIAPRPGVAGAEALTERLRGVELLLVLDNFEHLLGAAPLVGGLLAACPRLRVLATSRSRLRLSGEQVFPIAPLATPDPAQPMSADDLMGYGAVRLFVARAREVVPGFALTAGNGASVAGICRRLDGLPLAIELAAPRTRVLSPAALLARLTNRLQLLTGGPRDQPVRLRTLEGAIAWSYDLLTPAEQALFRRLAVFVGGVTAEAAEEVGGDGGAEGGLSVLEALTALVDASLLGRRDGDGGEPRFVMLETIRDYAWERLATAGEEAAARDAHAALFLAMAERAEPALRGPDPAAWLDRLAAEVPNVRAALAWLIGCGAAEPALRLAGALGLFWTWAPYVREGREWLEAALALPGAADWPAPFAKALDAVGTLAHWQGDFGRAEAVLRRALALHTDLGDQAAVADALGNLGNVALETGDLELAAALLEESLPVYRAQGNAVAVVETLHLLGHVASARGDHDRSVAWQAEAVALARGLPQRAKLDDGLLNLGWAHLLRGGLAQARAAYAEGLALAADGDDALRVGRGVRGAACLATAAGGPLTAARLFAAAAAQREREALPLRPTTQVQHDRFEAAARATLGEGAFGEAWAVGSVMPLGEAAVEAAAVFAGSACPEGERTAAPRREAVSLSPREREVLDLLVEGRSDKEIAAALFLSRYTASKHVAAILAKLDVPSRGAAVAAAHRAGLA